MSWNRWRLFSVILNIAMKRLTVLMGIIGLPFQIFLGKRVWKMDDSELPLGNS
jgi:hypothetical protein